MSVDITVKWTYEWPNHWIIVIRREKVNKAIEKSIAIILKLIIGKIQTENCH